MAKGRWANVWCAKVGWANVRWAKVRAPIFNNYVKTIVTFSVGPGTAQARESYAHAQPGPQNYNLCQARACKFQARTRPDPHNIIEARPGPAHGLRAGLAHGPRPGPCRTLIQVTVHGYVDDQIFLQCTLLNTKLV